VTWLFPTSFSERRCVARSPRELVSGVCAAFARSPWWACERVNRAAILEKGKEKKKTNKGQHEEREFK
jgi:hypothetical protein